MHTSHFISGNELPIIYTVNIVFTPFNFFSCNWVSKIPDLDYSFIMLNGLFSMNFQSTNNCVWNRIYQSKMNLNQACPTYGPPHVRELLPVAGDT